MYQVMIFRNQEKTDFYQKPDLLSADAFLMRELRYLGIPYYLSVIRPGAVIYFGSEKEVVVVAMEIHTDSFGTITK